MELYVDDILAKTPLDVLQNVLLSEAVHGDHIMNTILSQCLKNIKGHGR